MFFLTNTSEASQNAIMGILLVGVFFLLICSLFSDNPKPDPDEHVQREIAKKILRGEMTAEEVARKEGYDPKHIGKWINDYTQLAVKYALDCDKHVEKVILLEEDIAWLEEACRKNIGDDWKEKTGFGDHELDKYK